MSNTEKEKKSPPEEDLQALPLYRQAPKLRSAILFFIHKIPEKLNRVTLCKHLYYSDGHYYQKYEKTITELDYLHIEGSPQPLLFNEIMHEMVTKKEIEIFPQVVTKKTKHGPMMVLKGMVYRAHVEPPYVFSREEKKVLNSVALLFKGDLSLETRYYPNLYQQYTQTGLYEKIEQQKLPQGTRPHLSWKAWANKRFRLKWQ
ncbi:MAG: type II toxin-antitoxin system antitoxin SocA domain-containing protein [Leptospirales bacterium]